MGRFEAADLILLIWNTRGRFSVLNVRELPQRVQIEKTSGNDKLDTKKHFWCGIIIIGLPFEAALIFGKGGMNHDHCF